MPATVALSTRSTQNVTCTLLSDGKDMSGKCTLIAAEVYWEANKIPTANFVIQDGKIENGGFDLSDGDDFKPGKIIEFQIGYQNNNQRIFKGIVVKHGIKLRKNRPSVLELVCKDPAVQMTAVRKSHYFHKQNGGGKDSDIFQQIMRNYQGNLRAGTIQATDFEHEELVQYNCTDWDFMRMRAEANGMLLIADGGVLNCVAPDPGAQPSVKVTQITDLLDFEADIDAELHYPEVSYQSWDPASQQQTEKKNKTSGTSQITPQLRFPDVVYGNATFVLFHGGNLPEKEMESTADARFKNSRLATVLGRMRVRGVADLKPNTTLLLEGLSKRFDGRYFVSGVVHSYSENKWETDVQLGLPNQYLSETGWPQNAAATGRTPGISGLQTGIVTKIEGNGDESGSRICVRIPHVAVGPGGAQDDGIWVRLGMPYAGDKHGFVFRPEIGDEVILGFLNDDPSEAVVIGALFSKKYVPPIPTDRQNKEKGIFAREQMKCVFNEQDKSLLLETGKGYSVLLNDSADKLEIKDPNGNSLKFSPAGIELKSGKEIKIEAAGNLILNGLFVKINS